MSESRKYNLEALSLLENKLQRVYIATCRDAWQVSLAPPSEYPDWHPLPSRRDLVGQFWDTFARNAPSIRLAYDTSGRVMAILLEPEREQAGTSRRHGTSIDAQLFMVVAECICSEDFLTSDDLSLQDAERIARCATEHVFHNPAILGYQISRAVVDLLPNAHRYLHSEQRSTSIQAEILSDACTSWRRPRVIENGVVRSISMEELRHTVHTKGRGYLVVVHDPLCAIFADGRRHEVGSIPLQVAACLVSVPPGEVCTYRRFFDTIWRGHDEGQVSEDVVESYRNLVQQHVRTVGSLQSGKTEIRKWIEPVPGEGYRLKAGYSILYVPRQILDS